jgi:enoyl-[acyl-carrier protein] reductase II
MPKFAAVLTTPDTTGDFEEMCLPAGEGVTTITRIRPAAEIVEEMMAEARAIFEAGQPPASVGPRR